MPGTYTDKFVLLISVVGLVELALLRTCSANMDPDLDAAWSQWKITHAKQYPPEEEEYRRSVWEGNWKKVEEHNREAAQGKHTYTMAMNKFADLTNEEFKQKMLMSFPEHGPR